MRTCLGGEVDGPPRRVPRSIEDELRKVVQEVTVIRAATVEDRADVIALDQHVEVDEVIVDEVTLSRALVHQLADPRQPLVERADGGGRSLEHLTRAWGAPSPRLCDDSEELFSPRPVCRPPVGAPPAEPRRSRQVDRAHRVES